MPGDTVTWFLAKCWACGVEVPFDDAATRDQWVKAHGSTQHSAVLAVHSEHVDPVTHLPLVSAREVTR